MQFPKWIKGRMWWGVFNVYDSRKTPTGWVVGQKLKVYVWAREGTQAAEVLSKAVRHECLEVTGRMKAAVWRRAKRPLKTIGIDVHSARSLGLFDFSPHMKLARTALAREAEKRRNEELRAAQLSEEELEQRAEKLLAELGQEV